MVDMTESKLLHHNMGLSTNWKIPISQVLPEKFAYTSIDKLESGQVKVSCDGNNVNDDLL
jgi:hypothetical protein